MKRIIRTALCMLCVVIGMNLLLAGCINYTMNCEETFQDTSVSPTGGDELTLMEIGEPERPFGSASGRQSVTGETEPTATQPEAEIQQLDIAVIENRENELVFDISLDDFIISYNSLYFRDKGREYLRLESEWQCYTYDSAIHSDHETKRYYFTEDERIYSLPTITVYVPTNGDYIQEVTVNFDEHSYTEWGIEQYREMCYYTLKVFFPDLTDKTILDLCTEAITLGNRNVFPSDAWYGSNPVPYALFHKDGIGVYPYFAIGDWEHLCIIPVTEETIAEFKQKGVEIYEIS